MIYKNRIYSEPEEFNALIQELEETDALTINKAEVDELLYIMVHTEYTNLRGKIAIFLSKRDELYILESIIGLIKNNIHTRFIGSLIYSCGKFDCSEFLGLFVDIILLKDDSTISDAYGVIESIKSPVDPKLKQYCINKLKAFNELIGGDKSCLQTIELISTL